MSIIKKMAGLFSDVDDEIIDETPMKNNQNNKSYYNEVNNNHEEPKKMPSIFSSQKREDASKMKVNYVSIVRPKTFEDARLISDSIKDRKVVTFSLEYLGFEIGQRVIDFVSGTSYAMDAHLSKITDKVFTSIPSGVGYEDVDKVIEDDNVNGTLL